MGTGMLHVSVYSGGEATWRDNAVQSSLFCAMLYPQGAVWMDNHILISSRLQHYYLRAALIRLTKLPTTHHSRSRKEKKTIPNASLECACINPSSPSSLYSSPANASIGSTFQILSAYSLIHLSLEKNPILATAVIHLPTHSSFSLYA